MYSWDRENNMADDARTDVFELDQREFEIKPADG